MKKLIITIFAALALSQGAFAATGQTAAVKVETLSIINTAFGGHIAGNVELKILGGFTLPLGVFCNTAFITTKKSVDPDRAMYNLLRDAKNLNRFVKLWVSDDLSVNAYPGRCSIVLAELL